MPLNVRRFVRRAAIGAGLILLLTAVAGAGGALWLRSRLVASLPVLDGRVELAGLDEAVRVERDALGVPTLRARGRVDLARATGFVHAQDRFFQMDLLRRSAAGELSELFGRAALETDRARRVHRFRAIARGNLEQTSAAGRALIDAYRDGVNAGLASLGAAPPEYVALRLDPAPWRSEDTILVILAMYIDLQGGSGRRESALGLMAELLPRELVDFLLPPGTEWDAPLVGPAFATPPPPGAEVFDLRRTRGGETSEDGTRSALEGAAALESRDVDQVRGSNNWAVSGARSVHGGALLANDMHLGLGLPNIWYRASFVIDSAAADEQRVTGVTLPGTPAMVAGSNGQIAWGFTNSQGDWSDLIVLEPGGSEESYLTPGGPRNYETHDEVIRIRGGEKERLTVRWTIWGPRIDEDHRGRPRALRWVAHLPGGADLGLLGLETARDVDEALAVARRSGIPAQNIVVADRAGRIGWTLMGRIPERRGFDGRTPASWADGTRGWDGWLDDALYPTVVDPPGGRIWTANNRVGDAAMSRLIGDGGFALGARAGQIRDGLDALAQADEAGLLAIQLDDRARFLERWRKLLLELLTGEALEDPRRAELRDLVELDWSGHASIESAGYRMVRGFRSFVARDVLGAITAVCGEADERFDPLVFFQYEGPLWRLVNERPPHLLDARFESWNEQLLASLDALLDYFDGSDAPLASRSWGERNLVRLQHPFSRAVPQLARWIDAPARTLPGDSHMPRVQSPGFGASERMVVSPGRESSGILHMPGGQSGHPFSPWYLAGHDDWATGRPTPLLPGPTVHTLELAPAR